MVSLILASMLLAWALLLRKWRQAEVAGSGRQLPPGPAPWPVVGNIFQLGSSPHHSFFRLAAKHGPVMTIHLGAMRTVVVSSASAAREMFKVHDAVLAGRMIYESMKLSSGREGSIITAQLGPHWRMLRRVCATQFFTNARIDSMEITRRQCLGSVVLSIEQTGRHGALPVDLGHHFFLMAFNHISYLTLSRNFLETDLQNGIEFFKYAKMIMELAGKPNVADFVPALRCLDPQGIQRKMDYQVGRALAIMSEFLEIRIKNTEGKGTHHHHEGIGMQRKDLLDMLLEFEGNGIDEPAKLSSKTILNLILELFIAGTDTTTSTLEWVMAELLRHPSVKSKVQDELSMLAGTADSPRQFAERDIVSLGYLNAVVKETLRLHPPLPLLVPHKATNACTMLGHHIPQDTQILVNVWGLGRESKSWVDPAAFRPERFMEEASSVDWKGQHFEFIPFGSGRRMCPAVSLMSRMLPLAIGTLLLAFDWSLPEGVTPENMDMRQHIGISLRKTVPLRAIAVPCKGGGVRDGRREDLVAGPSYS